MQQRANGDHACASCKHQRKKCKEDCLMAPFFPANLSEEFGLVHKTFGVSNVAKQLKKFDGEEYRRLCSESLIWVATCFENDPVQGPHGEHQRLLAEHQRFLAEHERVVAELNYYKAQAQYYNSKLPPAAIGNSQGPANYCLYSNHPPASGTVVVMAPNGQVLNNGWSGRSATMTTMTTGTTHQIDNINGCLVSSVAGYDEHGSLLRVDNNRGGPIGIQYPYHNTENNGNGAVQDSVEGQDNLSGTPVINLAPQQRRRQQQPPPPPSQPSFEQLINQNQNMGNKELQDQKHRPNCTVVSHCQHQQQNYPMASFSQQQSFNVAGQQYHPTSSDANLARSSTTTTTAGSMDNGSRWTANSL